MNRWAIDCRSRGLVEQRHDFPKILIFAVNELPHASHADHLVKTCRDLFNQGDDFLKKITGNAKVDHPRFSLADIFAQATPRSNNPVNLTRVIAMIDEEDWSAMDVDVQGGAFEGLLEKATSGSAREREPSARPRRLHHRDQQQRKTALSRERLCPDCFQSKTTFAGA